jgi:hypothetical protein
MNADNDSKWVRIHIWAEGEAVLAAHEVDEDIEGWL